MIHNFSYLTLLKALTIVLPLVTFPYLIQTLGASKYGLVMWAWSISQIFIVFIKFGFDTLGVKLISQNRNNKEELSYIISQIIYIKIFLLMVISIVFFLLLFFFEKIFSHKILFLYFYVFILFESMLPVWYFQGIENMKVVAVLVSSIKLLFALLVFLFINKEDDYLIVPLLYTVGSIFSVFIACFLIFIKDKIKLCNVRVDKTLELIKESKYILLSDLSVVARDKLTIVFIERYLGLEIVAYFDISIKIINVLLTPFHMVSQVLYPHIAKTRDMFLLKKVMFFTAIIALIVVIVFTYNIENIASLLNNGFKSNLIYIMSILIFIIPIGAISGLLGSSVLIVFQQTRWLLISTLSAILFYFIMLLVLVEYNALVFCFIYVSVFVVELLVKIYIISRLKLFKG